MSTESVTPDLETDLGVLIEAESTGRAGWGTQAPHIRALYDRYPAMPPSVIARKVGCDPANVTQVINRYVKACTASELEDFQANKPAILEAFQHRTLASITDEDISKTPFIQRITAFAIMEDKIRLMRGQPTSLHAHILVDVLDMLRARDE